jgi:hypothetical protein
MGSTFNTIQKQFIVQLSVVSVVSLALEEHIAVYVFSCRYKITGISLQYMNIYV